jgi:hypothetical protein
VGPSIFAESGRCNLGRKASEVAILYGEERANMRDPDEMLTPDQLTELKRRLAMLHSSSVEQVYRDAYQRCAPVGGRVPKASAIQELVAAWKQLRDWEKR